MRCEWKKVKISDVCKICYGKDHKQLLDGNVPAYGSGGIIRRVNKSIHEKKSVLIPRKGSLDNLFFVDPPFWTVDTLFWTDIDETKINPAFFFYQLKTLDLASKNVGTAVPSLTTSVLNDIEINLPSMDIQKQIAAILSALDEKIAINRAINDNLQQQAFSVFDNLIANTENNDCTVFDYAFLNPKRTLAKNQVARSIDMSQLSTSGAFPSGWEMKPFNGGMRFTNGDTLLARITPCLENGKTAFIDFLDDGEVAFGSTEYIVLAPKNDTPPEMLYCLARYPAFVDYAVKNMNGSSGRQRVSAETVGQYRLPLFDKHSLVLFREVVSPMFLKMRYNSLENMRLAELRDALLPKLMSGEIDVSSVQF